MISRFKLSATFLRKRSELPVVKGDSGLPLHSCKTFYPAIFQKKLLNQHDQISLPVFLASLTDLFSIQIYSFSAHILKQFTGRLAHFHFRKKIKNFANFGAIYLLWRTGRPFDFIQISAIICINREGKMLDFGYSLKNSNSRKLNNRKEIKVSLLLSLRALWSSGCMLTQI